MAADTLPLIPGYEIRAELARGGGGIVYRAWQQSLERLVAIKVIRPERLADAEAVRQFQREAKAAARLNHPHIVGIFDFAEANGVHYLVMEHIDGIDLGKLLAGRGPLPIRQTCDFIRQTALGLAHAHEKGLVHRDIKPSNLMASLVPRPLSFASAKGQRPRGKEPLVKILDFGLARFGRGEVEGGLLGTPDYLAPEQIEDAGAADIRADLYGLGCSFYHLLTGRVPFPDGSLAYKLERHRSAAPTPIARLRPRLPSELTAMVNKLMAKSPTERFQTPAELIEALDRLLRRDFSHETADFLADTVTAGEPAPTVIHPLSTPAEEEPRRWEGHEDGVFGVTFTPDGRLLSTGRDGTLRSWNAATGEELARAAGIAGGILGLAAAPDGKGLALAGRDGSIRLWDSVQETRRLDRHQGEVLAVAISPDGLRLLSGGRDQTVRLWSMATGKEIRRIGGIVAERHWDGVLAVAFSAGGRRALSGSRDRTARLWDLETGREIRCFRDFAAAVHGVAFLPDDRLGLTAGGNRLVLWNLENGEIIRSFTGHDRLVLALAVSKGGHRLATGGEDGTVRLWETATGKEARRHAVHQGPIHAIAFSPDGQTIVSGGADRTICVWRVPV